MVTVTARALSRATGLGALFLALATTTGLSAQERYGSFFLYREADPIDDTNLSRLLVEGTSDSDVGMPMLVWQCSGERLDVYVDAGRFLDSSAIRVQYRLDDAPPSEPGLWPPSSDGNAAFAPRSVVTELAARARPAAALVVRVRDYRQTDFTLGFPLDGLAAGLDALGCAAGG